ncbi:hypothetical protein NPIL_473721 [Nephila pilipes]|uniref:Uncharacterized protein n=1 Tax=Nephila pilipes TaxID=299642 RepID=A0A8X6N1Y2_NEPPI|nr:hypothetical protein NPIL_473721 [Nephila pilipes]
MKNYYTSTYVRAIFCSPKETFINWEKIVMFERFLQFPVYRQMMSHNERSDPKTISAQGYLDKKGSKFQVKPHLYSKNGFVWILNASHYPVRAMPSLLRSGLSISSILR